MPSTFDLQKTPIDICLSNLAACLNDRYLQEHKVAYLDEATAHESAALDLWPPGHPDRSQSLHDLTLLLRNKSSVNGRMDDLERAIEFCRAAIDLRPPGDPDRHWSLSNPSFDGPDGCLMYEYLTLVRSQRSIHFVCHEDLGTVTWRCQRS